MGWIGVDLDGTLARYDGWKNGAIGTPIPEMIERVKRWLADGKDVRIFTARVCVLDAVSHESGRKADREFAEQQITQIQDWCEQHIGQRLPVTNIKDFAMIELWDDRCVQVHINSGVPVIEDAKLRDQQQALWAAADIVCRSMFRFEKEAREGGRIIKWTDLIAWQDTLERALRECA